jgi:hypothetical protein
MFGSLPQMLSWLWLPSQATVEGAAATLVPQAAQQRQKAAALSSSIHIGVCPPVGVASSPPAAVDQLVVGTTTNPSATISSQRHIQQVRVTAAHD